MKFGSQEIGRIPLSYGVDILTDDSVLSQSTRLMDRRTERPQQELALIVRCMLKSCSVSNVAGIMRTLFTHVVLHVYIQSMLVNLKHR